MLSTWLGLKNEFYLYGIELSELACEALAFCVELAEKGVQRAKARAKVLAMVVAKGTEDGWKMVEKLKTRPYAEDDEDDKAIRRAKKEIKTLKQAAAAAVSARALSGAAQEPA
ncbi:hypothetical protein CYMTET_5200 [Cymbomonas tetramitiformis]|uniref:Uncharacterized protein n=1 Tax=Cymbomonas tetramitiformis TaxID=36881 RepID=A0AAE0LJL6_9CHLO|nr:hypothetical protein CYMTET_5200 [Cymbomonas tetramitiformis]